MIINIGQQAIVDWQAGHERLAVSVIMQIAIGIFIGWILITTVGYWLPEVLAILIFLVFIAFWGGVAALVLFAVMAML